MSFEFSPTEIPEVIAITPRIHGDDRGAFAEIFKASEFHKSGIDISFAQMNYSKSARGVLRGLHFQRPPHEQGKLVLAVSGEIFDVAADIRVGSPTYGQWVGAPLSAGKKNMLWVPPGFAHGFCVTSETAEVMYFVTGSEYAPEAEGGIIWSDKTLNIQWPTTTPILSEKDKQYVAL